MVNTTANFTIAGVFTHNANVVANASSILVQNASTQSVINTNGIYVGNTSTNVVINNTLSSFGGSASFGNNVTVTNQVNSGSLNVSGLANVNTLTVNNPSGTSVVNGNFTVLGTLSAGTLATSLTTNGSIIPTQNNVFTVGTASNNWLGIYASSFFAANLVSSSNVSTTTFYATSNATINSLSVSNNMTVAGNVQITGTVQFNSLVHTGSGTYTFNNSTLQANIDQMSATTFRSVEYQMQLTDSSVVPAQYHVEKISIVHDNTTAYMTEYGIMYTTSSLGTFDASINGGNIVLKLTPSTANVVAKFIRTAVVS